MKDCVEWQFLVIVYCLMIIRPVEMDGGMGKFGLWLCSFGLVLSPDRLEAAG